MKRTAAQRGFTLIEIVLVITILGVLAAFAVPRFVDLKSEARGAALNGMVGSMRSAAALAHSMTLAQSLGPNDPVVMEGASISMIGGYPDAQGMAEAAQLSLAGEFQIQFFGNAAFVVYASGTPGWTSCGFAYVRAIPPSFPAPRYFGPLTGNCR